MAAVIRDTLASRPLRRLAYLLSAAVAILVMAAAYDAAGVGRGSQSVQASQIPTLAEVVTQLQGRIRRNPDDAEAYAQLSLAFLQQVRLTHDVALYGRARQSAEEALRRNPQQVEAVVAQGMLALAMHDFAGALSWGQRVRELNPYMAAGLGILVDGQIELGRYDEAARTLQTMVDLRPNLESYSRVSYLREIYGDLAGAEAAMQLAASTALPGSEPWLWTTTYLGHLAWGRGELDTADRAYRQVLARRADYPFAQAGLARVQAARGDVTGAIAVLEPLAQRLPLPEFLVLLGEMYEARGDAVRAREQYELVHVIQDLNRAAGMAVDLELATFEVNHGDDVEAALAMARAAYARRPTIYAADTLAWAYDRAGDFHRAQQFSRQALRLGTQDALLHYHAGMIAEALGQHEAARNHLATALALNPHFSLLDSETAQQKLQNLYTVHQLLAQDGALDRASIVAPK